MIKQTTPTILLQIRYGFPFRSLSRTLLTHAIPTWLTGIHIGPRPIRSTIQKNWQPNKHNSFQFERYWLRSEEARNIILQAWHSVPLTPNSAHNIIVKYNRVRKEITSWEKNKYYGLKQTKYIIRKLDTTKETRNLTNIELQLRIDLHTHAYNLVDI
jgi:hypothetical protein